MIVEVKNQMKTKNYWKRYLISKQAELFPSATQKQLVQDFEASYSTVVEALTKPSHYWFTKAISAVANSGLSTTPAAAFRIQKLIDEDDDKVVLVLTKAEVAKIISRGLPKALSEKLTKGLDGNNFVF